MNELYRKKDSIIRVLSEEEKRILVLDCIKKSMPRWVNKIFLEGYEKAGDEVLPAIISYDELPQELKKMIHERFGSISLVLSNLGNEEERNRLIQISADEFHVSKSTIRLRLCQYLVYMNICALLPVDKKENKEFTLDEKNFRWALNKYYYNSLKLSLKETYRRLLKDKYCDSSGRLLESHPTFRQFEYFFRKTMNKENFYISREGKGDYMRNHRVLLGNGIRDFCPTIGYGMLDSTVLDIYLVNSSGELVGRPIMTACIDGYSGMCLGYSLGYEGGIKSITKLIENVCADKSEWCRGLNIDLDEKSWNCSSLPHKLITDRGAEYASETFSHLTELGVELINLPPYRPELKSAVVNIT